MSYQCVYYDAGRSHSKRPKQNYDCTVRALAIVTDESYDAVYDQLAKAGRKSGHKFKIEPVLKTGWPGWIIEKISFPARKGQTRMNPVRFALEYPDDRYIVKVAKHVFVFLYGIAYDDFPKVPDSKCIYWAWRFTRCEK